MPGERGSLLALFSEEEYYKTLEELCLLDSKSIDFTSESVGELLAKERGLEVLARNLHDLDLTNESIVTKLGILVVGKLVKLLRQSLEFECTEQSPPSEPVEADTTPTATAAASMACDSIQPAQMEDSSVVAVATEKVASRKRLRSEGDLDSQDATEDDDDKEEEEEEKEEQAKKSKTSAAPLQPSALDVLTSAVAGLEPSSSSSSPSSTWLCVAPTNTWVGRRRARRQATKTAAGEGDGPLARSLPPAPPVLVFSLAVKSTHSSGGARSKEDALLSVELAPEHARYAAELVRFIGFFRKHLRSAEI